MIEVDKIFADVFGDFAINARIILTYWVIFGGAYLLARTPRKKRTPEDGSQHVTIKLFFAGFAIATTVLFASV